MEDFTFDDELDEDFWRQIIADCYEDGSYKLEDYVEEEE